MTGIVTQVSLYPLRQEKLSPAIDKALQIFRKHGLHVEPGVMSTVIAGDEAAIFCVLQEVWHQAAAEGQVVMVVTFSNACPVPETGGVEDQYVSIPTRPPAERRVHAPTEQVVNRAVHILAEKVEQVRRKRDVRSNPCSTGWLTVGRAGALLCCHPGARAAG